jgi:acetyl-CoA synthetase
MAELEALRAEASATPEEFWARFAESELQWFKKWDTVLKWQAPHAEWFARRVRSIFLTTASIGIWEPWRRNKAALIWEGEPGDPRTLTYQQLHSEVCRCAA